MCGNELIETWMNYKQTPATTKYRFTSRIELL